MDTVSKELKTFISSKFDEAELIKILQENVQLTNMQIKHISFNPGCKKGDSYLSTITKFTVSASGEDKSTKEIKNIEVPLIAKSLPKNIIWRKTNRSADFFSNEVIFYDKVWKAMKEFQSSKIRNSQWIFNDIPLYISGLADGEHDYVTLEDVSGKGYTAGVRSNASDYNHTKLIMKLFAKFHALGLAFKHQQPEKFEAAASSLQEKYFAEKYRKWYITYMTKTLFVVVRDAVAKQLPELYLNRLNEFLATDVFGTLVQLCEYRGPLAVVTQGDVWIPNFLLKYGPDNKTPVDAIMIDFQLARYVSLAHDIVFFLYSCTEQSLRLKYWDTLIEDYHRTFVETLEALGSPAELLTLDALKAEIKRCAIFGVGVAMEVISMSLLDDDETADLDSIQGDEEIPIESVWVVHPFKSEEKRQRLADMIKYAVDNDVI